MGGRGRVEAAARAGAPARGDHPFRRHRRHGGRIARDAGGACARRLAAHLVRQGRSHGARQRRAARRPLRRGERERHGDHLVRARRRLPQRLLPRRRVHDPGAARRSRSARAHGRGSAARARRRVRSHHALRARVSVPGVQRASARRVRRDRRRGGGVARAPAGCGNHARRGDRRREHVVRRAVRHRGRRRAHPQRLDRGRRLDRPARRGLGRGRDRRQRCHALRRLRRRLQDAMQNQTPSSPAWATPGR